MTRNLTRLVWSFCLVAMVFAGCTSDAPESDGLQKTEVDIRVGLDPNYPPFESLGEAGGPPAGFDIDLISEICRHHGWTFEIASHPFEELIGALNADRIDVVISALTITPEREAMISFSDPYYLSGQSLVVVQTDTLTVDLSDLTGRRVGVQVGSTAERIAEKIDGATVYSFHGAVAMFESLASGQVDVLINDHPVSRHMIGSYPTLRVVPGWLEPEYYGIALRLDDSERREAINDALAVLIGSYQFEELHLRWFGYPLLDQPVPDSVSAQWPDFDTTRP